MRVGGVHSGSVRGIEMPNVPSGKITVLMDLQRSTHDIIKQDSVAAIETEGLLGNEYVSISFGSARSTNVKDDDTIASQPPLVIADLMKKADGILDTSQEALDNVAVVTANLSSISGKINLGQGTVGALVNDKKICPKRIRPAGLRDTVNHAQAGVAAQESMEAMKQNVLLRGYFKKRGYENSSDLAKNEIMELPHTPPLKTFTFESKQLFDNVDTAKPKNQKSLRTAGQFLADTEFGVAVVVVSTGSAGDTEETSPNPGARHGGARLPRRQFLL